jgi:hypothetical protein
MPTRKRLSRRSGGQPKKWTRHPLPSLLTAPIEPELLYTQMEAAAFLRMSPRTLEQRRSAGREPLFMKNGRRVVYAGSALLEYAAKLKAATDTGVAA